MTTLEMILSVLTAMSGIGNLTQWVNLRALRQKSQYEAEDMHIEVLKKTIEMQSSEIERLQNRVKELEDRAADRERLFDEKIAALESKLSEYAAK